MTFERGGHTLTGTDRAHGAYYPAIARRRRGEYQLFHRPAGDARAGPGHAPYARVPAVVKPNASMPILKDGTTSMDADEFVFWLLPPSRGGAGVLGGCCGTTPGHIAALSGQLAGQPRPARRTEPSPPSRRPPAPSLAGYAWSASASARRGKRRCRPRLKPGTWKKRSSSDSSSRRPGRTYWTSTSAWRASTRPNCSTGSAHALGGAPRR